MSQADGFKNHRSERMSLYALAGKSLQMVISSVKIREVLFYFNLLYLYITDGARPTVWNVGRTLWHSRADFATKSEANIGFNFDLFKYF